MADAPMVEKDLTWGPVRHIRQLELGDTVPMNARFLGMHIEQRDDGLRITRAPVFFYEVYD